MLLPGRARTRAHTDGQPKTIVPPVRSTGSGDMYRHSFAKCIKILFGFHKFYGLTSMLTELGLHSFNTFNVVFTFNSRVSMSVNSNIT